MRQRIFRRLWPTLVLLMLPYAASADWEPSEIVGLEYPRLGQAARITGLVVVRLTFASDGSVVKTEALSGHPLLVEPARKNASQWKFRQSGRSSDKAGEFHLVYRFVLEGSCAANECHTGFTVEYPNLVLVTSEMPSIQPHRGESQ